MTGRLLVYFMACVLGLSGIGAESGAVNAGGGSEQTACEVEGCTIAGEHTHNTCGVEGCTIAGEHTHNTCGVEGCTIAGEHTHEYLSGHHDVQSENGHHGHH